MRKLTVLLLAWLTLFSLGFLAIEASLALSHGGEPVSPVLMDQSVVDWDFNMSENRSREETWEIRFDDMFPYDAIRYTLRPKFYNGAEYRNGDALGIFHVLIEHYLNGELLHKTLVDHVVQYPGGGAGLRGWSPSETELGYFVDSFPKPSGNVYLTKLKFWSEISTPGEGRIEIAAGPLLLSGNPISSGWPASRVLTSLLISGVVAVPAACVVVGLTTKMSDTGRSVKRRRP